MNIAYAQKSSTVQKKTRSEASSIFDSSSQSESLQRKAELANGAVQRVEPPRPNNTGMPDNLKAGIESLSGFSMDDVRVHYNSSKPATVQALAYTQGTDIHVAPGQEKHLPHEAWHVAQQMAGRVSPTTNINGMPVNDNATLEHEADVMGEKAVTQRKINYESNRQMYLKSNVVQRIMNACSKDGSIIQITSFSRLKELMKQNVRIYFNNNRVNDVSGILDEKTKHLSADLYGNLNLEGCDNIEDVCKALGDFFVTVPAPENFLNQFPSKYNTVKKIWEKNDDKNPNNNGIYCSLEINKIRCYRRYDEAEIAAFNYAHDKAEKEGFTPEYGTIYRKDNEYLRIYSDKKHEMYVGYGFVFHCSDRHVILKKINNVCLESKPCHYHSIKCRMVMKNGEFAHDEDYDEMDGLHFFVVPNL